jgi:hypothetical protein
LRHVYRIVVQGTPPFLIVHKNAACCRLTGIDAHFSVGKHISALLSIPFISIEGEENNEMRPADIPYATGTTTSDAAAAEMETHCRSMTASDDNNDKKQLSIDRLIMTSGCCDHFHVVHVCTKLPCPMVGRNVTVQHHNTSKNKDHQMMDHSTETNRDDKVDGQIQNGDEDGTSLTSKLDRDYISVGPEKQAKMVCRISIAPIVLSKDMIVSGTTDMHDPLKRIKHQHPSPNFPDSEHTQHQEQGKVMKLPIITHYVIQFQPYDDEVRTNGGSMESIFSSHSVEARYRGVQSDNNNYNMAVKTSTSTNQQVAINQLPDGTKNQLTITSNNSIDHGDNDPTNMDTTDVDGSLSVQSSDHEPIVTIG